MSPNLALPALITTNKTVNPESRWLITCVDLDIDAGI